MSQIIKTDILIQKITDRLVILEDIDTKTIALLTAGDFINANERATRLMLSRKRREWVQRVTAWGYNGGIDLTLEEEFQTRIKCERKAIDDINQNNTKETNNHGD